MVDPEAPLVAENVLGINLTRRVTTVDENEVQISFWDTPGQDRFTSLSHFCLARKHDFILAFYSLHDKKSFDALDSYMGTVRKHAIVTDGLLPPVFCIGTKADLPQVVTDDAIEEKMAQLGFEDHYKTSALLNQGIAEAIEDIAARAIRIPLIAREVRITEIGEHALRALKSIPPETLSQWDAVLAIDRLHSLIDENDRVRVREMLRDKTLGHVVLNGRDSSGRTPLYKAFSLGHQTVFEALIQAGASFDNFSGGHPLLSIVANPAMLDTCVRANLLTPVLVNMDHNDGNHDFTLLAFAILHRYWDSAKILLNIGANPLLPGLGISAVRAVRPVLGPEADEVRDLIHREVAKKLTTAVDRSKVNHAAAIVCSADVANGSPLLNTPPPLLNAVKAGNVQMTKLLLEHGADPTTSFRGKTALQLANSDEVRELLRSAENHAALDKIDPVKFKHSMEDIMDDDGITFDPAACLGVGGMAAVYRGRHSDSTCAVKVVDLTKMEDYEFRQLQSELYIHQLLRHKNVIALYAMTQSVTEIRLAMELASGSLWHLIDGIRTGASSKEELPWPRRLKFAREIAVGMKAIARKGYEHRDLKSLNVLIANGSAKISDFGLTVRLTNNAINYEGTLLCQAPERFSGVGGEKSDVYAFGIILWELATLDIPYRAEGLTDFQLRDHVIGGGRPSIDGSGAPALIAELYTACIAQDPADRPSFADLVDALPGDEAAIHSIVQTLSAPCPAPVLSADEHRRVMRRLGGMLTTRRRL
ncbi:Small GTPase superfamily [Carpediemonas membranifera]|uniref:Small GTPase superfamily n=1 Tax=Carpediemonas membranifera TaxID=201153 RepID=A0A8J6B788_9EUKA|nr:Small GTPase superfamily [Carpediemonas membranifera]|eukprot:KAG9394232.1 Small GTPase superfamily [Carpediemonas membranifera]